ncbi:MAG: putative quinol monooxygenase [Aestuariivirga sp.]
MNLYVITVEFVLKHGTLGEFRRLVGQNATDSCRDEPGCQRFDVLVPLGQDTQVFLYEIYDNRAAFETHLKTPHFDLFNRNSADMVLRKRIVEYDLVCEGSQKSEN